MAGVQQVEAAAGGDDSAAAGTNAADKAMGVPRVGAQLLTARRLDGSGRAPRREGRRRTAGGDEGRRRRHGPLHRLGRQCPVGEQAGGRGGKAVSRTARIYGRHRRGWHHQRRAVSEGQQGAGGAEGDGDAAGPPAADERVGAGAHVSQTGRPRSGSRRPRRGSRRQPGRRGERLALVRGGQAHAGHRYGAARMRVPHHGDPRG
jgi:hypothetical protein